MPYFTSDFLAFFADLRANNDRDWFKANKKRYETAVKKPFETLANAIIGQQISVMAPASILRKLNSKIPSISAKNINKLHHMTLRSCGLSRQKILYLKILSNL